MNIPIGHNSTRIVVRIVQGIHQSVIFLPCLLVILLPTLTYACEPDGGSTLSGNNDPDPSHAQFYGGGWGWPANLGTTINTALPECRPAVSPGGDTLFFEAEFEADSTRIDIWMSVRNGNDWGPPVKLGPEINSDRNDTKPYLSPDGQRLYFVSSRSFGQSMDIYVSTRDGTGWSQAVLLDSTINSPYDEGTVSLSFDGNRLYFQSNRPGGYGNWDLWVSEKNGDSWGEPVNLGPNINTCSVDWFALEDPTERKLYITQERPGGYGGHDIWISDLEGSAWSLPTNGGLPLNYYITCSPTMTRDGGRLFFGGGRMGEGEGDLDIWTSRYDEVEVDTALTPRPHDPTEWEKTSDLPGAEVVFSLIETGDGDILAGTYPGGRIYRTADRGEHWTISDSLPGAITVFSLMRTREGTLLAGTFPNGDIFRSTDDGDSWLPTEDLEYATEVRSIIESRDVAIYAGTAPYGDVFVSIDDGRTWDVTGDLPDAEVVVGLLETSEGTLFAGTLMWTGIYRSTDRGVTWENYGTFPVEINHPSIGCFLELPGGDLLAGHLTRGHGAGRGVYRSTDQGSTWTESGYFPPPFFNEVWSLIRTARGTIYAGVATRYDDIVYRSDTNGFSWELTGGLPGARETFCLLEGSDGTIYAGTSPNGDVYRMSGVPESKRRDKRDRLRF